MPVRGTFQLLAETCEHEEGKPSIKDGDTTQRQSRL
jgi:hypothetical protein